MYFDEIYLTATKLPPITAYLHVGVDLVCRWNLPLLGRDSRGKSTN